MTKYTKRVTVIASGETERRAIPILWRRLDGASIDVNVRIPPHGKVSAKIARQIIQAQRYGGGEPPDKYVILVDTDGKTPDEAIGAIRANLSRLLPDELRPRVQYAYAQWHLEAWYFADAENLRRHLGDGSLGHVDTSRPDEITRPKEHLKNLLRRDKIVYTARLSAQIAEQLDPHRIGGRSPSFRGFGVAVRNGPPTADAQRTDREEG